MIGKQIRRAYRIIWLPVSAQGAYLIFGLSKWALIRGWAPIKFHHFQ